MDQDTKIDLVRHENDWFFLKNKSIQCLLLLFSPISIIPPSKQWYGMERMKCFDNIERVWFLYKNKNAEL